MTDAGLIDRLRRDTQAAIDSAWREAQASADAVWAESERVCEQARADSERATAQRTAELVRRVLGAAERDACRVRTEAKAAMAERLRTLAISMLPALRDAAGPELFAMLAAELPDFEYDEIIVAPHDGDRARLRFPGARISCDAVVAGGIDAYAARRRIRIDNTLATRLEVVWPCLLPLLMREVLECIDDR